jgi:hypothetical protein
MAITGCHLRNVTADGLIPGLREAGDVVDLDYPPFFIDRVEDAVPPGPQAPQIRRPAQMIEAGPGRMIRHDVSFAGPRSARLAWQGRSP